MYPSNSKSFFGMNKISSFTNQADPSKHQVLTFLKSTINTCRLFGVFPCVIVENRESRDLVLKADKKWWLVYSAFIFCITTAYMVFQVGSLVICAIRGHSIVQLADQSLWVNSGLVPYAVSIFMMVSGDKVVGIFHAWCKIEMELESLFCHKKTKGHICKFKATYSKLALLSVSVCGYHALIEPYNPVYPFYYFMENNGTKFPQKGLDNDIRIDHVAYSIFQMLEVGWIWAGVAVLEGLCCLFATVFIQCMESVTDGLEFCLSQTKVKDPEADDTLQALLKSLTVDTGTSAKDKAHTNTSPCSMKGGKAVASTMSPEEYLRFAIRKLQTFISLQSHINSVLGPFILLDFGQLVIMTCALSFLPIIYAKALDYTTIIAYAGNWAPVFARLVIIVMCLGNVYIKGQEVNVELAKAMNSCKLSPQGQSSVLAHLTVFSSNPVAFTAWGFFPITRGTLLAAFSLISTYAVIFLQLNT